MTLARTVPWSSTLLDSFTNQQGDHLAEGNWERIRKLGQENVEGNVQLGFSKRITVQKAEATNGVG